MKSLSYKVNKYGLDLWASFLRYWSLRKAYPLVVALWFDLIETDQEFRLVFGDEVAEKLIQVIEKGELTQQVVDLMR